MCAPITHCLGFGQLGEVVLGYKNDCFCFSSLKKSQKQTTQDLPHEDATEPHLHEGLHPHRQLCGDGPHPICHSHCPQPQALSGYQGEFIHICNCKTFLILFDFDSFGSELVGVILS